MLVVYDMHTLFVSKPFKNVCGIEDGRAAARVSFDLASIRANERACMRGNPGLNHMQIQSAYLDDLVSLQPMLVLSHCEKHTSTHASTQDWCLCLDPLQSSM